MPIGIPTQDQLNKYTQTNTASTTGSNSSTDYLSGNSLLGKTDTTTSSTKNDKINVETNNKDSNAKIIGRGLKELVPSIAKGVTSAVDSLADAPSAIAAGIANKAAENDATLRISANKAIERVKANQAEHALGENVKNWEQKVDARQQAIATDNPDSKLAQTVYKGTELAESIGQMVPSIAASAITGGIGGAVTKGAATAANIVSRTAEAAGLATMFGNVYSSSLKENTDQGYEFTISSDKAFRDALTEVGTELLFGGIAGTGKALITPKGLGKIADDVAVKSVRTKLGDKLAGSIFAKSADALNTFSKTRIGNFLVGDIAEDGLGGILGEAAEEMISEIIGPYNERATTNPEAVNATLGEVLEAGLGGAIISAVFGGAQGVASKIKGVKATSNYNKWQSNPKETLRAFSALQNGADVESNAKKVFANFSDEINVNVFKDQFALPGDLKVELPTNIDLLTDAEAQAAVDAAIPQLAVAYKEYARRRALQAMSGEYKKAISSDSLASKSANVIEAQTKLDNAIKQATDLFGAEAVKNGLTTELNEQLKAQGIDINALEKDVIRRTNQAKKTIGLDISRAIKNGTAVDTYGQELIDQYLASKELNDVNTTLKVQSKSGNVDFGGYLRTTDADGNTVYRTANQISQERFGKNYNKLTNAQQAEIASEYIIQKQERLNRLTEAVSEMQKSIKASGTKNFNVAIATPEQIAQTGSSTSNAWWDSNTNTMYFNPEKATTKNSAYSFFAHEATHKIVDDLEVQDPTGAKKREFFDTITKAMYQSGYPVDAMIDKTSRIYGLNYYKQAYKALESGVYNSERLKEVYDETKASAGKGLTEKDIREIAAERFAKERLEGYDKNTDKGNVHVDGMLEEELMAKFMEKFFGSSDLMLELAKTNKTSLEQIGKAIKNSSAADIKYNKVLARTRYEILANINDALAGTLQTESQKAKTAYPDAKKKERHSLSDTLDDGTELTDAQVEYLSEGDPALLNKKNQARVWYKGRAAYQDTNLSRIPRENWIPYVTSFFSSDPLVATTYTAGDHQTLKMGKIQNNMRVDTLDDAVAYINDVRNYTLKKNANNYRILVKDGSGNIYLSVADAKAADVKNPQYAIGIVLPGLEAHPMAISNYTDNVVDFVKYVREEMPAVLAKDETSTKPGTVTKNIVRADKTYVVDATAADGKAGYWDLLPGPDGADYNQYREHRYSQFDEEELTPEFQKHAWSTDMLVAWAYDNGYDSVLVKNVSDTNSIYSNKASDVLVVINPVGKVKDIANTNPTFDSDTRYSLSDDILEEDPLDWEEGLLDEFMGLDIEDEMLRKTPDTDALGNPLSVGQQYFYADSIGTRDSTGKLIPLVPSPFAEGSPYAEAGGYYYRPATASDETGLIYYGKMTRPVQIKEQFIMDLLESTPDVVTQYGYDGVKVGDNLFMFVDEAQIAEATDLNPLQTYEARMSLSDDVNSEDFAPFDMTGLVNDTDVTGVSDERMRQYEELRTKYGLNNGTSIPGQINSHVGTSRLYGRLIDSNQTPNQLRGAMVNQLLEGIGTHLIMTDDAAMDYVQNQMAKYSTLNEAVDKTKELYTAGHMVNKNELAFGQQLLLDLGNEINRINYYNETVTDESLKKNTDGLVDMAESLLADLAASATRAGQNLQAFALLKKMTPQGRLYYLDAQIEQYVSEMVDRKGNSRVGGFQFKTDARGNILRDANGNALEIKIPDELRQEMLACTSQEELNAVEEKIVTAIAKQIPATLTDRVVAWRYLSMLGNPRTHIRNIVSNIAMGGLVKVKNTVKGALEDLFLKEQTSGRTSTNKRIDPTLKKAYQELAIEDWDKNGVSDEALSGGKVGFQSLINQKRNKFGKSGFAEAVNKLNNLNTNGVKEGTLLGGLEGEDYWSGKNAYVQAFTKYCAANNLDVDYLKSGTVNSNTALAQARSYAVNEAAKATYHDANNLAQHLAQIERQNGTLGKIIVGGLIPFKKTPGNILKRGIEYSPIGLINGAIDLVQASRTTVEDYKGEYSALNSQDALNLGKATQRFDAQAKRTRAICDAIDRLSAGLTGTGILLLGYFLGSLGILKGAGSDNDREKYYDQMQGTQEYSITIAGKNFTLDWLTPSSMPLFAGVAIADLFAGDTNFSTGDILTGLSKIADPVMNLSVLQGVNDALGSYDSGLGKVALSAAEGYIGQMIPTLAGQIARTIDPTRRTTYAPTNDENASSKEINTFINRMKNKLPFASQTNQEYIDMWGRTESRGDSIIGRFFSQAVAPWYQKDINQTEADDLIAQVYQATGDRTVIPTSPESSYTIGSTTYRLSEKEYHDVKETVGQLSYAGVYTLKQVPGFSSLSPEAQADIIANIYSFARKIGKSDYAYANGITYEEDSSTTRIKQAVAAGMTIGEAIYANYMANNLTADKDANGKTISGSKKAKVYSLYQALGLTDAQIKAISQYEYD